MWLRYGVSPETYNFYSLDDEVFEIYNGTPGSFTGTEYFLWHVERYAWHKQESYKGLKNRVFNGIFVGIGATDQAGWGFNRTILNNVRYSAEEAAALSDSALRCDSSGDESVFRHNPDKMFSSNITYNAVNSILAKGIPALSYVTGRNEVATLINQNENRNLDIATLKNGWPRSEGDYANRWLHNDIRNMAYLYTFKAFDEIVIKGELK